MCVYIYKYNYRYAIVFVKILTYAMSFEIHFFLQKDGLTDGSMDR